MKISATLLTAMLISATLAAGTGCKTKKSNDDGNKRNPNHERHHGGQDCPGCGMG